MTIVNWAAARASRTSRRYLEGKPAEQPGPGRGIGTHVDGPSPHSHRPLRVLAEGARRASVALAEEAIEVTQVAEPGAVGDLRDVEKRCAQEPLRAIEAQTVDQAARLRQPSRDGRRTVVGLQVGFDAEKQIEQKGVERKSAQV